MQSSVARATRNCLFFYSLYRGRGIMRSDKLRFRPNLCPNSNRILPDLLHWKDLLEGTHWRPAPPHDFIYENILWRVLLRCKESFLEPRTLIRLSPARRSVRVGMSKARRWERTHLFIYLFIQSSLGRVALSVLQLFFQGALHT